MSVCERCGGTGLVHFHPNDVPRCFLIFGGAALLDSEGRHRMVCPRCKPYEPRPSSDPGGEPRGPRDSSNHADEGGGR